jgi:hypothetical protein
VKKRGADIRGKATSLERERERSSILTLQFASESRREGGFGRGERKRSERS